MCRGVQVGTGLGRGRGAWSVWRGVVWFGGMWCGVVWWVGGAVWRASAALGWWLVVPRPMSFHNLAPGGDLLVNDMATPTLEWAKQLQIPRVAPIF